MNQGDLLAMGMHAIATRPLTKQLKISTEVEQILEMGPDYGTTMPIHLRPGF